MSIRTSNRMDPDPGHDSVALLPAIVLDAITDVEYTHELGDDDARILVAAANRSTI